MGIMHLNVLPQFNPRVPIVSNRIPRFLMLWLFVALQVMTPFIHAHASVVQFDRTVALHVCEDLHSDAVYHASAIGERGTEVRVAQAMPMRRDMPVTDVARAMVSMLPCVQATARPGAGLPASPPLFLALPDHILPHALAPPFA